MTGSSWAVVWTLIASVIAAIAASVSSLIVKRRRDRLRAQLDLVNAQLRDFYGPLLSTAEASEKAWVTFKRIYKNGSDNEDFWDQADPPTHDARIAYHHWIKTLFIPLNDKMAEIVSTRLDLLIDRGIPQCLTDLYVHALTRKTALAMWDDESGSPPEAAAFPAEELLPYLEASFIALKDEQARLLKAITATQAYPLTQGVPRVSLISDKWTNNGNREAPALQEGISSPTVAAENRDPIIEQ
jgi:hypothetical protein